MSSIFLAITSVLAGVAAKADVDASSIVVMTAMASLGLKCSMLGSPAEDVLVGQTPASQCVSERNASWERGRAPHCVELAPFDKTSAPPARRYPWLMAIRSSV